MADDANEQQEALIPDEEVVIQEPETTTTQEELDVEALKAEAAKAKEFKDFAARMDAENKKLKKQLQSQQPETTINKETLPDLEQRLERQDLRIEGYKDEEIDFIMRNGGKEAMKDPLVKAAIDAQRAKEKSRNASPSNTGKSPVLQKYTEQDLKRMPLEELEKLVPFADQ